VSNAASVLCGAANVEYFHGHARLEQMFFGTALRPIDGELRPDLSRPGLGLELKIADAERYVGGGLL